MGTKKQENGIIYVGDTAEKVAKVKAALEKIDVLADTPYKTPGKISLTGGGSVDVQSETDDEKLYMGFASILLRASAIENSYKELGRKNYPVVKIDGGSVDAWKHDINLKLQINSQQSLKSDLKATMKKYEALMDRNDQIAQVDQEFNAILERIN